MASSSKSTIRSISLPSRPQAAIKRIEEELNKLKKWGRGSSSGTTTSKTIGCGISSMVDLYESTVDVLNSAIAQNAINHHQNVRFVDGLQEGLMSLLDMCGTAREVVSLVKEHIRVIQSCLRRRKGGSEVGTSVARYVSIRKKMNKESKKVFGMSKQMENKIRSSLLPELDDHLVSATFKALREVVSESFSVLETLLVFLYVPMLKPKRTMLSKLLQTESCEDMNELQRVDVALQVLCSSGTSEGDGAKGAQNSLKSLEENIESIEIGLQCLFRGLIKTRTSLLNVVSS